MSDKLLRETLRHRAARATVPDRETVLAAVREHRELRARRRRNAVAAGGGAAVMAGLVAGTVLLVPDHSGSGSDGGGVPAGGPPASRPTSSEPVPGTAVPAGPATVSPGEKTVSTSRPSVAGRLHRIPAAPKSAPLAVTVVPEGWRYLASGPTSTLYGPRGLKGAGDPNDFEGRVALLVGERYSSQEPVNTRVGRFPASYYTSSGTQMVAIDVSASRLVTIQVPASAHLTKDQVLTLARTLDIRSLKHASKG